MVFPYLKGLINKEAFIYSIFLFLGLFLGLFALSYIFRSYIYHGMQGIFGAYVELNNKWSKACLMMIRMAWDLGRMS